MFYLLLCRSLTYAQRSSRYLERKGISAPVIKAPPALSANGCSYALRVAERHFDTAVSALTSGGLEPRRIFILQEDGPEEFLP